MEPITDLTLQILERRGYTSAICRLIKPTVDDVEYQSEEITQAGSWFVERLKEKRKKTLIIGDYDVDGLAASSIIAQVSQNQFGLTPQVHIPEREDGYGVRLELFKKYNLEEYAGIIIVDSGTNHQEVHAYLKHLDIPTLILDHHTPSMSNGSEGNLYIYNPHYSNRPEECSASIAFKLASYYNDAPVLDALGYAAMATLTDCMPMHIANHSLVKVGLPYLSRSKGISAILQQQELGTPTAEIVNWRIGPRLNAPGRLNSALPALQLLLTTNSEEAEKLALQLEDINQQRRQIQDLVFAEAIQQVDTNQELIIAHGNWHPGVVGIVAARLCEDFQVPAIVLGQTEDGMLRGSGRTARGISLIELLKKTNLNPSNYGGHAAAVGVSLKQSELKQFQEEIKTAIQTTEIASQKQRPELRITTQSINRQEAYALEQLAPFGSEFPEPVFAIKGTCYETDGKWQISDGYGSCPFVPKKGTTPTNTLQNIPVHIRLLYSGNVAACQA